MPLDFRYRVLLGVEVFDFYQTLRLVDRRSLREAFQFLADHPFSQGDYQEEGQDGRHAEVLLRGCFSFSFWTDHAAKEVRILRIDRA